MMFVPGKTTKIPRTRVSHCHVWFCPKIKDPWEHMLPHFISWLPFSKLTSMWKIQISRLFSRGFPMVFYLSMFVCPQVPGWFLSHQSFRAMGQKSQTDTLQRPRLGCLGSGPPAAAQLNPRNLQPAVASAASLGGYRWFGTKSVGTYGCSPT